MNKYMSVILGCILNGSHAGFTTLILDSKTKEYTWFRFSKGKLVDCLHKNVMNEYSLIQSHLIQTGF